ncbi:unnamed protein product [Cylindrotheca closterium]|uniref:Uncharacterized protein n=1 Tax=Cylindrotheca closterium TaxID=2856 RepID=A0AAD2G2K8_9STRA|nr:unnamed protein product [Cylindrotheca closterium]
MPSSTQKVWCLLSALSFLSLVHSSGDSLNVDLEVVTNVDLRNLGVEGLDIHAGKYSLTVDASCQYTLQVDFKEHSSDSLVDVPNRHNFQGDCDKVLGTFLHQHNRNWMQFKQYVQDTTGFDHMSLYPRPCGMEPLGRRQPRYDVNFYTADSHHRAMWVCRTFDRPEQCEFNQPNFLGRGHFTIPRLAQDPDIIANTPANFTYDPDRPQALEFEGLIVTNSLTVPETPTDMKTPEIEMSTYDGDTVSFRVVVPYKLVTGDTSGSYSGTVQYEYQNMMQLPGSWSVNYNAPSSLISVVVKGKGKLCGAEFDEAKQAQESG